MKKPSFLKSQRKKKTYNENRIQSSFFDWLRLQHPKYEKLCFSTNGEGKRSYALANAMRKAGLKSGIPDVFCPIPINSKPGLFIEFKDKGKKVTENQAFYLHALSEAGYECAVCYSVEEAIKIFTNYVTTGQSLTK